MSCPKCGAVGIHACPGHPIPAWTPLKRRELARVLREYERPASRNQREGWFVGNWQGKAVRRREPLEPLTVLGRVIIPGGRPVVDNAVALDTLVNRRGTRLVAGLGIKGRWLGQRAVYRMLK